MPNRRPGADAVELDTPETARSLNSVIRDFEALAAVFQKQLDALSDSDPETRSHIAKAKAAADRGLQLSQELMRRIKATGAAGKLD